MLIDVINKNEFRTVHKIESSEMYDFCKWQDLFYRSPASGTFKQTHIFETSGPKHVSNSTPTLLKKWDYDGANVRTDSLLPTRGNKNASICLYLRDNLQYPRYLTNLRFSQGQNFEI